MLDELEEDAIREMFNLSLGHAVPTLSEMVDAEIEFSPPCIEMTAAQRLIENIEQLVGSAACLVQMGFKLILARTEEVAGTALLLLRGESVAPLLDALYGEHVPESMHNEVCRETFTDVGDLLLYTCVSTLSGLLDADLEGKKPVFFRGNPRDWNMSMASFNLRDGQVEEASSFGERQVANLRVDFSIPLRMVGGSVVIWLDWTDKVGLRQAIRRFIATRSV
ncbi:MAG: hypothetical protein HQL76_09920 [Magnetococcales bacterium]|nr:hypothetical protein [Magnetococcales bacterium]